MTWFLLDRKEYSARLKEIGAAYRDVMGRNFPAMTALQVSGLIEDRAKVEIQAIAMIPDQMRLTTRRRTRRQVQEGDMATKARENHREDVAGRANVEDTPELLAYYDELERLEAGALWTVANKIEPWQPKSSSVPVLWRYEDLRAHVLRSVELVSPEKAGRRVIYLNNPGRREHAAAVGWLYSGLQVMHPGEVASAHAHSASALRFIMEGEGAYTIVDGHKMTLGANDFVLTPNGTWHEHGVSSDGTPCIWQDGLDIPLVNTLEANFYAVHPELQQSVGYPVDDMTHTWGNPGLRPAGAEWSQGIFAAAEIRVGADLRGAAALRQGHRRLAL